MNADDMIRLVRWFSEVEQTLGIEVARALLSPRTCNCGRMSMVAMMPDLPPLPAPPEPDLPDLPPPPAPEIICHHSLSEREVQILRHLEAGRPNKMIARDLRVTEATIKVHLKSILRKLRVTNRTQAAIWAHTNMHERA